MKSVQELREALDGLYTDAQALADIADSGKELSDEQLSQYKALTDDNGDIAKAEKALAAREEFDAKRREIVNRHKTLNRIAGAYGPVAEPAPEREPKATDDGRIYLKGQKSRYFDDPRQAKAAAEWFAFATAPTSEARSRHAELMQKFGGEFYNAQSIGTDGKGGYLVPEPIAVEIIKNRDAIGQVAALCNTITMGQETLRINEESTGMTVYYPGESGSITASDLDWVQHTLTVTKRAALVKMSREFIADANVSAADQIIDRLSYDFAYTRDNEIINGDGTSTYGSETGLVSGALAGNKFTPPTGDNTIAELVLADFTAAKNKLGLKYREGASWIMGRQTWDHVESLALAAGGTTTVQFINGMEQNRFLGYPVVLSELMPAEANSASVAFFGNFRKAVAIGDRNDMTIETSTERYFETDDVAIRATHRYDILVHNNNAYATLALAAS